MPAKDTKEHKGRVPSHLGLPAGLLQPLNGKQRPWCPHGCHKTEIPTSWANTLCRQGQDAEGGCHGGAGRSEPLLRPPQAGRCWALGQQILEGVAK